MSIVIDKYTYNDKAIFRVFVAVNYYVRTPSSITSAGTLWFGRGTWHMIQTERGESCCKFGVMKKIKSFRLAVIFISVVQILHYCSFVKNLFKSYLKPVFGQEKSCSRTTCSRAASDTKGSLKFSDSCFMRKFSKFRALFFSSSVHFCSDLIKIIFIFFSSNYEL